MSPDRNRVPDWLVERLAAGDLPPDRANDVRRRLSEEEGGGDRLDAIRRSNEEILLSHPPRELVPQIERRAGVRRKARRSLFLGLPVLAAAAAAALVLQARDGVEIDPGALAGTAEDTTRTKGSSILRIYRKNGARTEQLEPGALVRPRDLLQVSYVALGKGYGVVFSIDGRGNVTLHYPEQQGRAQALVKSGEVSLPHAYELDDAPEFERFFIVSSEAPIDVDAVLAGARSLAKKPANAQSRYLELPEDFGQYSITLRKEGT